ncbi:MAG: CHRD domain-containing protein [Gemmatimonadales bacterium]
MQATRMFTVLAAVALIGVACEDDDPTGIPSGVEIFTATLNGANEVPALVSPTEATGTAVITVMGNLISWRVDAANISNVFIGHIHLGPAGQSGDVLIDLEPTPGDYTTTQTIALGSLAGDTVLAVLPDMRAGNTYVNIHTSDGATDPAGPAGDYPAGEIRGQLVKQ